MKYLIIYAHPNKLGHNGYILEQVKNKLKEYEVLDLYAMNYDPVLKPSEHYSSGHRSVSTENLNIQEKIREAKHLIFIFPMWWGSMPAILKGFMDKVLTPRFAFSYIKGKPIGLLKDKTATTIMTTGGPIWLYKLFFLDAPSRHMKYGILRFCGIKSKFYYVCSCLDIEKNRNKINKLLNKIF